jgi:hypothetical protein
MIPPRGVTSITSGSSELIITPTVGDVTISINLSAYVPTSRSINTTAPLAGGGTLASDLTLSLLDNGITDAKLRDSAGTSVIGRAAGTVGDPADIVAVSDGDVLRRAGGTLGFGTIPSTSVTGLITAVNAGTNLSGGGTSGAVTLNVVDSPTFAGNVTVQGATGFTVSTPLGTSPAINWQQGTLQTWKLYQVPSNHTLALDNSSGGNVAQFTSAAITWQKPTTFIQYAQWGSLGPYLTTDQTLNFGRGSTGVVDGYINYYGYNGGITQFRNLRICDGKGADIAKFTGSTKQVDFLGPVTVAGNATIGDSAGDAHALNGTLNANSTAGVNGQVLQVIGGLPQWGAPSAASIPTGTGTANKLTKWTGASTLGDSSILTESGSVLMVNGNLNVDSSAASVFGGAGALLLQNSGTGTTVTPLSVMRTSLATNGDVTEVTIGQNAAQARIWTTTLDASDLSGDLRIGTRWYNGTSYVNTDLLVDGNGLTVYRNAYLNATTGSTGIGYASGAALPAKLSVAGTLDVTGAATVSGGVTLGNASTDAHALNGTLAANGTAGTNGQVLQIVSGLPQWGAPASAGIATGSGTANRLVRWTGATTLGDGSIIDDGASATVEDLGGTIQTYSTVGTTNDLPLAANTTILVYNGASAATWTGITGGRDGRLLLILNRSSSTLSLSRENAGSAAADRIWTTDDATSMTVNRRTGILLMYNGADQRWQVMSHPSRLGYLTVDGWVSATQGVYASNSKASLSNYSLNFGYNDNATIAGKINAVGYADGVTQFRDLQIQDGKGATIATFTGSTKQTAFAGSVTVAGDVALNTVSGNTTVGAGNTTNSAFTFQGREGVVNSAPVAMTQETVAWNIARAGTFDTTAGALISTGLESAVTSSRSAGANNLTNRAALFTAGNAQINIAVETQSGDNYFNTVNGKTAVGTSSPDTNTKVHVWNGASGAVAALAGSVLTVENNSDTYLTFKGPAGNAKALLFNNPTSAADGGILYDHPSTPRGLQFRTGGNVTWTTLSSAGVLQHTGAAQFDGTVAIGNGAGDAHTLNGTLAANSTAGTNGQVLQIVGGLPQWAAPSTAGITSGSGTVNRVAKWTGANALGDSTVSDDGTYVYTPSQIWGKWSANTDGGVALAGGTGVTDTTATTNGFDFGMGSGGVVWRSKLATGGTIAGYVGAGSNPGTANQWLSVSGTGDVTFPKAVTVAGNATLGDSTSSDDHIIRGRVSHLCSGFADSFYSSVTSSAATYTVNGATFKSTGTFDTVAAQRFNYGLQAIADANRISEVNALNNIAISATASNGQTNVAIYTADGSNYLNGASGSTGIGYAFGASLPATLAVNGTFATTGAVTLGDASTDAHALNGTLNANGTAGTNGQVLQIISGLPQWGAPSAAGVVTGTGTVDRVTKWTGTSSLGNSTITDDGTNITLAPATGVHVSTGYLWHGPSINTYISSSSGIGFHFNANLDNQTGYINYAGYGGGTSRTRNLIIADGKGAAVATFTGSTKQVDFAGAITVTGPGGNASGRQDAIRISNFSQATSSDSQVIHWQFNAPDVYNVWAGAKLTGTTPGFLNPKFIVAVQNTNTTGTANVTERLGVHSSGVDVTGWLQSTGGLYANSSNAFLNNGSLNFFYNTNATAQGKINAVGYQEGISQFRDLLIQDGKGATIATFTGSTKQVAFAGAVTIAGNTSLGDASTDAHTLNGTLNANSTAGADGQVLTIVGGLPKWGGDGYTVILKGADQDASNAFVDDTTLLFPTVAGKLYAVECFLNVATVSGAGAAGLLRFKTSTGSMDGYGNGWANGIFTAFSAAAASLTNQMSVAQRGSLAIPTAVNVSFAFRQNTSSSNFILQFSATNSGDTMRMLAGSWMRYRQLN